MPVDPFSLDRALIAALLAALAVGVSFGPELGRMVSKLRSRRIADVASDAAPLGVEPQQS